MTTIAPQTFAEFPLFPDVPRYDMQVQIAGKNYGVRLDYNGRENRWNFSLFASDGEPIATGLKVVCNWDMLYGIVHAERPPGQVVFFDLFGSGEPPTFADLGRRVRLGYYDGAV